jgi:hypothetical protein
MSRMQTHSNADLSISARRGFRGMTDNAIAKGPHDTATRFRLGFFGPMIPVGDQQLVADNVIGIRPVTEKY